MRVSASEMIVCAFRQTVSAIIVQENIVSLITVFPQKFQIEFRISERFSRCSDLSKSVPFAERNALGNRELNVEIAVGKLNAGKVCRTRESEDVPYRSRDFLLREFFISR